MSTTRNPRSGLCSDITREPLPGTAKTGRLVVAVEVPAGWGKDILDGDALGRELTGQVKRWLKRYRAQLQFIRRPGREGQTSAGGSTTVFIADAGASPPTLERLDLAGGVRELPEVDLSTPGSVPGAVRVGHPLLLVCTHGKRDRCCAVKGRPLAAALAAQAEEDTVWESSHTKGHRFAPSMIQLPHNYSFGDLDPTAAARMLQDVVAGRLPVTGNRGRGTFDSQAQVAELAVAAKLVDEGTPVGLSELEVEKYSAKPEEQEEPDSADSAAYAAVADEVDPELRRRAGELLAERIEMKITGRHAELKELRRSGHFQPVDDYERVLKEAAAAQGLSRKKDRGKGHSVPRLRVRQGDRAWVVTLQSQTCHPVVSSCGDRPKEGRSWVAVEVSPEVNPGR